MTANASIRPQIDVHIFRAKGALSVSTTLSPNNYPSQSPADTRLTAQANKWEGEEKHEFQHEISK
jgi:hypothetical protein